jgi:hypothetical protein
MVEIIASAVVSEVGVLLWYGDHKKPDERFLLMMHVTEITDVAECFGSLTPQHTQGMYCYPFLASRVQVY